MAVWEAIVLGIVQGLGEFLPISSSGHLLLLEKLGVGEESLFFNVMLHVATLLAVLVAMRKQIAAILFHPIKSKAWTILVATIPTVAIAILLLKGAPSLLDGTLLPFSFMLTAFLLTVSEKASFRTFDTLSPFSYAFIGAFQGIAVLPGLSRSGATIAAARLVGTDKNRAAEFSFLLSIPIVFGSALYEGYEVINNPFTLLAISTPALVAGMLTAFVSGLIAIKFFLKLLEKHSTMPFAIYTAMLSLACLVLRGFGLI